MKEIYCFDMFPSDPLEDEQISEDDLPNGSFIRHMDFENQDTSFMMQQGKGYVYELDHDFLCIKRQKKAEFDDFFQKALDSYIDGDWVNAQSNLSQCLVIMPRDGPMRWMIDYLEGKKNLAPESWKGMRDLDQTQAVPDFDGMDNKKDDIGVDQDANP